MQTQQELPLAIRKAYDGVEIASFRWVDDKTIHVAISEDTIQVWTLRKGTWKLER
jgi:hypothetical protein